MEVGGGSETCLRGCNVIGWLVSTVNQIFELMVPPRNICEYINLFFFPYPTMISRTISYSTSDQDDDCLITVRYAEAIFYLRWSPQDLDSAPELLQDYLAHLEELKNEDDDHSSSDRLILPFEALMDQLAPASKQGPSSLHDYLYPQWFLLKATVNADRRTILPVHIKEEDSPFCQPGLALYSKQIGSLDLDKWVPRLFSSHEIELPADAEKHPLLHRPTKVITKESQTEYFFKGLGPGFEGTINELVALRTIDEAAECGTLASDARFCRLYGLVVDTVGPRRFDKRVVGMLLNYIKPKRPGILGTLQYVAYEEHSRKNLHRWANDLNGILGALHRAGCIWGDAKPENVLVDHNDNVWIVDFGGGYTPGWVDEEQQGTQRGDLAAMEKIRQWLEQRGARRGQVDLIEQGSTITLS